MILSRIRAGALTVAAGLSLSACAYGDGYSGVSVGLGTGGYGYYDDYYDPYYGGGYYGSRYGSRYGRYGYGYSPYGSYSPFGGWYSGFYYPGTGFYVYDSQRRAHRWNDHQRRYWEGRRSNVSPELRQHFRQENQQFRQHYRDERQAVRRGEMTREQFRQHRREENRAFREHRRSHRHGGQ
jgi:hypothetical protein